MKPGKAWNFVGATLGTLMSLNGWSSSELAKAAGVSRSTIWRYQLGRLRLTREKLRHLAGVMGLPAVPADKFFVLPRESLGGHGTVTAGSPPPVKLPAGAVPPQRPGLNDDA